MFLDQVAAQPEVTVVRDQYIEKGVPFNDIFKRYVDKVTEGIKEPDVKATARLVAGMLISELTYCVGERLATKPPTTLFGRIRYAVANFIWKKR